MLLLLLPSISKSLRRLEFDVLSLRLSELRWIFMDGFFTFWEEVRLGASPFSLLLPQREPKLLQLLEWCLYHCVDLLSWILNLNTHHRNYAQYHKLLQYNPTQVLLTDSNEFQPFCSPLHQHTGEDAKLWLPVITTNCCNSKGQFTLVNTTEN